MKLKYMKDTDSLFIIFRDKKSVDSHEISDGVVADFDESGNLIGMEFYSVNNLINFDELLFDSLPFKNINFKSLDVA